jgi:hypothetical protein
MFSASFCATKFYSLGLLEFVGGPAEGFEWPYAWLKHPRPALSGDVFDANGAVVGARLDALGIGHNSLTVSPDLQEPWIVYHAKTSPEEGPADREARAQRFAWRADGRPDFGAPRGRGEAQARPSAAATYAVVCEGAEFEGRFCVGLPPGRYSPAELARRGAAAGGIGSVRARGGAAVTLVPNDAGEAPWTTAADAVVPPALRGRVAEVRVAAPAAAAAF